ncbi:taxifolin 8-monooxygenase [Malassezia vespertilionis]|nr:taxifolin 8-monooxygenase [Malassezia vespertilionis]WFD05055.1 taxifolin 8-monooxygenase [Malassezia vespertilionis]
MYFLERQPKFAWHPSLLLPGAQLQVSPIKDLATIRDPTSSFTFLNFLHWQGRLVQYINREEKVPSRREWSAYLAWAARRMDQYAHYSQSVQDIQPVEQDGKVAYLRVISKNLLTNEIETLYARNVSTAVGGFANVPAVISSLYDFHYGSSNASRVVHSSTFLPQMSYLDSILQREATTSDEPLRFAVIGGGQSSAEIMRYLRDHFPKADLTMIFRASALAPSDDSSFVNSAAFDPESVSSFWESGIHQRRAQLDEFRRTNYSVVRSDLLAELYEMVYDQDIDYEDAYSPSKGIVRIMSNTALVGAEQLSNARIRLETCTHAGEQIVESSEYDAVFLGTGFKRSAATLPFFNTLAREFPLLSEEGTERLREQELNLDAQIATAKDPDAMRATVRGITRDYRLVPTDPSRWMRDNHSILSMHPTVVPKIPAARSVRERMLSTSRSTSRSGSRATSRAGSPKNSPRALSSSNIEVASNLYRPQAPCNLYVFGCNEHTHGLSDSLMSMVAHRANVVSASLMAATQYPEPKVNGINAPPCPTIQ